MGEKSMPDLAKRVDERRPDSETVLRPCVVASVELDPAGETTSSPSAKPPKLIRNRRDGVNELPWPRAEQVWGSGRGPTKIVRKTAELSHDSFSFL